MTGIKEVEVDYGSYTATCYVDAEEFSADEALKALTAADSKYSNSSILPSGG